MTAQLSQCRVVNGPFTTGHKSPVNWARQIVCCRAQQSQTYSRRAAALSLSIIPVLASLPAQALIPDDDDEELIDLAKSRRKERLATERKVERNFVKTADYSGVDVSSVQKAVNRLAKEGLSLESGDLKSLSAASDSWVNDLKRAIKDLSSGAAAQKSSGEVVSSLDALTQSFKGGDLDKAKSSFSTAVTALQTWVADAGLSQQIKGL